MTTKQHTVIYPTYNRKTYTKRGYSQKYPVDPNKLSPSYFSRLHVFQTWNQSAFLNREPAFHYFYLPTTTTGAAKGGGEGGDNNSNRHPMAPGQPGAAGRAPSPAPSPHVPLLPNRPRSPSAPRDSARRHPKAPGAAQHPWALSLQPHSGRTRLRDSPTATATATAPSPQSPLRASRPPPSLTPHPPRRCPPRPGPPGALPSGAPGLASSKPGASPSPTRGLPPS